MFASTGVLQMGQESSSNNHARKHDSWKKCRQGVQTTAPDSSAKQMVQLCAGSGKARKGFIISNSGAKLSMAPCCGTKMLNSFSAVLRKRVLVFDE